MAKASAKKPAFGGYALSFKGISDTVESVMGDKPIGPAEMTKRLWTFVKSRRLAMPR